MPPRFIVMKSGRIIKGKNDRGRGFVSRPERGKAKQKNRLTSLMWKVLLEKSFIFLLIFCSDALFCVMLACFIFTPDAPFLSTPCFAASLAVALPHRFYLLIPAVFSKDSF